MRDDSPALKPGFTLIDYCKAGVYGNPSWVALAKRWNCAAPKVYPPGPKD